MRLGCIFMSLKSAIDEASRYGNIKELKKEEIAELLERNDVRAFLFFMYESNDDVSINYSKLFNDLGIPQNLIGYDCLKVALSLCLKDNYKNHFMKLYKDVGLIINRSDKAIDRNIRTAIEISINNMDRDFMEELFGYSLSFDRDKPTNSHYIYTIINYLKTNTKYLT